MARPTDPIRARFLIAAVVSSLALVSRVWPAGDVSPCNELEFLAALKGGGLVQFRCDANLGFTNTLVISADTMIDGGTNTVTISGGGQIRVFQVKPGVHLALRHLRIINGAVVGASGTNGDDGGLASGAGIFNEAGFVVADDCIFTGHSVTGGDGSPGLIGASDLLVNPTGGDGGNGGGGLGAAIFNSGTLTITNCTFGGNAVKGGKGGDGGAGQFGGFGGDGGKAGPGSGAAIYNDAAGTAQLFDSTFSTNSAAAQSGGAGGAGSGALGFDGRPGKSGMGAGGAIFNNGGTLAIMGCTFSGNIGTGGNGAAGRNQGNEQSGQNGQTGGAALGAALCNAGIVSVTNSTFFGNFVIGGTGGAGGAAGAALFGGTGGDGGDGGKALGGGIFNTGQGRIVVVNATLSRHSARGGAGGAAGVGGGLTGQDGDSGVDGQTAGAAVYNDGGSFLLQNSILSSSVNGDNAGGAITDGGFNLNSDASLKVAGSGSVNNVNPKLLSLADNGGPTLTMALATNSPAVNAITIEGGCPPEDQRHAGRAGLCDIGAFELNGIFPRPTLQTQRQTNSIILTWTSTLPGFNLETTTNVVKGPWQTSSATVTTINGVKTASISRTNSAAFFRLRKP